MKVQIKELERTHLLENQTKNLEISFLKEQLATLKKNREKDNTNHQVVVDNLNQRKVSEKNQLQEQLQKQSRIHEITKESMISEIQGIKNQLQSQVKA